MALALAGCSFQQKQPEVKLSNNGGLHGHWEAWSEAKSTDGEYGDDYWAASRNQGVPQRSHSPVPAENMLHEQAPDLFGKTN
ncbi:MAG: hypothetical protein IKZ87_04170 [Actinomycetaceae bacterium]|nr:hypothetical protein [Actinomycetaceae bacterium]